MSLMAGVLSARLREVTREGREIARRSRYVEGLATGRLPLAAYAEMAAQHWFVYETLELSAAAMADDPIARHFVYPELFRIPALEADLRFLYGARWQSRITALPATTTYCTRIRSAAFDRATGYVAHHCTRYLGDLSGGQWLGAKLVAAYGFNRHGYRFFVFEGVDPPLFRARYRDQLNSVPWSRAEQNAFLDEVSAAYRLNLELLAELEERWC
ncbi:heme oxygenase [Actinoplanes lutulentus]|uniref:Heme oxygenase n=1 Tax=Actinoplanes lutulentus TaxID=1287878 RepID=A0A327ZJE8_9ACTN|nr:biliverdin-producing heme oxygenase [Actinoplanes lutulentus]MBB2945286.1 heme oxygenase [Actinoplanes lutulentus]RAK40579.1 heme oxygenase [Actinoplanes lutulentus]